MSAYKGFEEIWKKFMTLCRAKLMEKSSYCALSVSAAEMSVRDASSVWFDQYEMCGQWLHRLGKENAAAAQKIKAILQETRLEPVPDKKPFPDLGVLGIAAGGAAAAAGAGAWIFQLGPAATLISAAIPAAVLYPVMKAHQKNGKEKAKKETIEAYLQQLSLVKKEIEGALDQNRSIR